MKVQAVTKYTRISPTKARPLAKKLRGLSAAKALDITGFSPKKAARLIEKTLKSAVANVEHNAKMSADDFHVENVLIEEGPTMRRYWSRSRGMARPIKKRSSHIKVILSND
jgi:large subunit ribosomal protein L22